MSEVRSIFVSWMIAFESYFQSSDQEWASTVWVGLRRKGKVTCHKTIKSVTVSFKKLLQLLVSEYSNSTFVISNLLVPNTQEQQDLCNMWVCSLELTSGGTTHDENGDHRKAEKKGYAERGRKGNNQLLSAQFRCECGLWVMRTEMMIGAQNRGKR